MSQNNRFYKIFFWMKTRCEDKNNPWYRLYWAKWIRVEWDRFEDFYDDMYISYIDHITKFWEKDTTIDRIDNKWNYCKGNCRWATRKEQQANKEQSLRPIYKWKQYETLKQLTEEKWVPYKRTLERMWAWFNIEDAIDAPHWAKFSDYINK